MNIKRSLGAALFIFAAQICVAQTATPDILTTAGGSASNASAFLSWTIGEPIIETGSSSSNSVTQGFQQPQNIVVTSVHNADSNSGVSAYPNPVIGSVFITSSKNQPLKIDVMDMAGRTLFSQNLPDANNNQVNLSYYSVGTYFIRVYTMTGQLLQTLKVEKVK